MKRPNRVFAPIIIAGITVGFGQCGISLWLPSGSVKRETD